MKPPTPDPFVMVPLWLLDMGLTSRELHLWILLRHHCGQNSSCFPSIARLVGLTGWHRATIFRILAELDLHRLIKRYGEVGEVTTYVLTGIHDSLFDPSQNCDTSRRKIATPPVAKLRHRTRTREQEQENKNCTHRLRLVDAALRSTITPHEVDSMKKTTNQPQGKGKASPKKSKDKIPDLTKVRGKPSLAKAEMAIDAIDLPKFRSVYPDLDVNREYEAFKTKNLCGNDYRNHPLWQKYWDWNRAFHSWLRNARKWQEERKVNAVKQGDPDQPRGWEEAFDRAMEVKKCI
jgi:hypothetical protein